MLQYITNLQITNFRNIASADLIFSPKINLIYGQNGAGKTSILEALYLFAYGRSFRTAQLERMIQRSQNFFRLHAKINNPETIDVVGLEKEFKHQKKLRLNGVSISVVEMAKKIPMQILSSHGNNFFWEGPKTRRKLLDWLMFHVEQNFFSLWQDYYKILRQRNAALRQGLSLQEISIWNEQFVLLSSQIDALRSSIISKLEPIFKNIIQSLLPEYTLELKYIAGWDKDFTLQELLQKNILKERHLGFTSVGPHKADLQILMDVVSVQDILSQGQLKLTLYSLQLAMGRLLQELVQVSSIFLVDDLLSELDAKKSQLIVQEIENLKSQVFATGIDGKVLSNLFSEPYEMFGIKNGYV